MLVCDASEAPCRTALEWLDNDVESSKRPVGVLKIEQLSLISTVPFSEVDF